MTTVAWDGKIIAADSQTVEDNLRGLHHETKILKHEGNIYAFAGTVVTCYEVIEWLKKGGKKSKAPDVVDSFSVMHFKDGKCWLYCESTTPHQVLPPYTMGTGKELALGAILAGSNARKAVEIACDVDINSGLPVLWYEVNDG